MAGGYILFTLGLMASALGGLIPSNVPIIGAMQGGPREPLTWAQTFWAAFWAVIVASVVVTIGGSILFFIIFGLIIASIGDMF